MAAMPFNFSSPEFSRHHKMQKSLVSLVSQAHPVHMNSILHILLVIPYFPYLLLFSIFHWSTRALQYFNLFINRLKLGSFSMLFAVVVDHI